MTQMTLQDLGLSKGKDETVRHTGNDKQLLAEVLAGLGYDVTLDRYPVVTIDCCREKFDKEADRIAKIIRRCGYTDSWGAKTKRKLAEDM